MSRELTITDAVESTLIQGDLSKLSPQECVAYYNAVCSSVGLNSLTKPFEYLFLNGKKILYAKKDATDQLRKIHSVSITKIEKEISDGVLMVTVYAKDASGREDSDVGAVVVAGLKNLDMANAVMKCTTKAKRRVTLSLCGLGLLDETEIEDISKDAKVADFDNDPFEKKAPPTVSLPEPKSISSEEIIDGPDLGDFVCQFGKKFAGKKLKEIPREQLMSYLEWIYDRQKAGSALDVKGQEFVETAEAFIRLGV